MAIQELHYAKTNTYLIEGRSGKLLFDTGWAGTFPDFCRELGEMKRSVQDIDAILISHYHPDHMGIAQEIAGAGAVILAADLQKPFLHASDGIFEKEKRSDYLPIRGEEVKTFSISDSRTILKQYGIDGEVFHTPGHSDDSISLWLDEGALFVGDLNPLYELELHKGTVIEESWNMLLALQPFVVYYGHARKAVLGGKESKGTAAQSGVHAQSGIYAQNDEQGGMYAQNNEPMLGGMYAQNGILAQKATNEQGKIREQKELYALVSKIMKLIDKGCDITRIGKKTGADPVFIEDVMRMYLTHQNVGVQGILDRIEIKNR